MEGKRIITISREFGSGGRSIGKAVAERLGIAYYDKELIKQVAEITGFAPEYIEENGEYTQSRWSFLTAGHTRVDAMGGMSAADFLWVMQRQVIVDLAEKEPCVIVGRCADYILRERTDCIHAFIHAAEGFKAERIVRLYGEGDASPLDRLKKKDDKRRINYRHYTDRDWGVCQNYTVSLDSGVLGLEKCVDILAGLYCP